MTWDKSVYLPHLSILSCKAGIDLELGFSNCSMAALEPHGGIGVRGEGKAGQAEALDPVAST